MSKRSMLGALTILSVIIALAWDTLSEETFPFLLNVIVLILIALSAGAATDWRGRPD